MKKINFKIFTQMFFVFSCCVVSSFAQAPIKGSSSVEFPFVVGSYGDIISSSSKAIDGAVVENFVLHVKESEDSNKILERKGTLVKYPQAEFTVLLCHGFMCDRFDAGFLRQLFPKNRCNFMTFDFRAHGENSKGQCCTFGRNEAYEVITAARFIKNHPDLKNKPIIGYGFSMGSVAAIEAQAKDPKLFEALILDSPFDSSENILRKNIERMQFSLLGYRFSLPGQSVLKKYAFHPFMQSAVKHLFRAGLKFGSREVVTTIHQFYPSESIKKVTVPCMFIHCKNDKKIPTDSVKAVYKAAPGYKLLWETNGRRHCDSFFYNPEGYRQRMAQFIDYVLDAPVVTLLDQGIIEDKEE